MSPSEYRAIRKSLELSQSELAALLELSRETICKRERGIYPISEEAVFAIRWIAFHLNK